MAWNTPSTWLAGAVLTAAQLNAQLRDNMKAIGDPWTTYTPTLTNFTVGAGTVVAKTLSAGKAIRLGLHLTGGSGAAATGALRITLPVTSVSGRAQALPLYYYSAGTALMGILDIQPAATFASVVLHNTSGAQLPWNSFATGHQIIVTGVYEGA